MYNNHNGAQELGAYNSYACKTCHREWTVQHEMNICPSCRAEGYEEILIAIDKKPAVAEPDTSAAEFEPLELSGHDISTLAQITAEVHAQVSAALSQLPAGSVEHVTKTIQEDQLFDLVTRLDAEEARLRAIAQLGINRLKQGELS
ncbi:hypothetical protein [Oceanobacter sp. 4_MG-2023]|uniref:hypothetical protein n=1 Tax=Oceanobacter sp. 4_MG-2023 TaxID=3062623 RepID=UPI002733CE83|nr:hypothetical protein [Oceanobacter sp. 4_MG-2023]MDP2548878.1 hypothetical protein [Oceanobacter sp. 4_MG-2023]